MLGYVMSLHFSSVFNMFLLDHFNQFFVDFVEVIIAGLDSKINKTEAMEQVICLSFFLLKSVFFV